MASIPTAQLRFVIGQLRTPHAARELSRSQLAFVQDLDWLTCRGRSISAKQEWYLWRLVCIARSQMPQNLVEMAREKLDEVGEVVREQQEKAK